MNYLIWRNKKQAEARIHHRDLIEDLGIPFDDFTVKTEFTDPNGRTVVGIYPSEFKKQKGIFFELIKRGSETFPDERTVYRVPASKYYEEEYEMNPNGSYYVPLDDLRIVNPYSAALTKADSIDNVEDVYAENKKEKSDKKLVFCSKEVVDEDKKVKEVEKENFIIPPPPPPPVYVPIIDDAPYSEMTIRDFYAIHTNKPVSNKQWLNDLINNKPLY
jgi:hypothetical protein